MRATISAKPKGRTASWANAEHAKRAAARMISEKKTPTRPYIPAAMGDAEAERREMRSATNKGRNPTIPAIIPAATAPTISLFLSDS